MEHNPSKSTQVTNLADPRRCKANTHQGQCLNVACEGGEFCKQHLRGTMDISPRLKQYLLTGEGEPVRIAQLADSETVKSLRETAAIANRLLERYYNLARTEAEFIAFGGAIDRQVKTVEKVVRSMIELEERTGSVLSQEQLITIMRMLAQIVHEELQGVEDYEQIEDRINERFSYLLSKRKTLALPDET